MCVLYSILRNILTSILSNILNNVLTSILSSINCIECVYILTINVYYLTLCTRDTHVCV